MIGNIICEVEGGVKVWDLSLGHRAPNQSFTPAKLKIQE